MQGEHIVDFAFDDTVLLQPGYERSPAMRSGGDEVVIVVEDTPTRVLLQHNLVDAKRGHVTKHRPKDWIFRAPTGFDYTAHPTCTIPPPPHAQPRPPGTNTR